MKKITYIVFLLFLNCFLFTDYVYASEAIGHIENTMGDVEVIRNNQAVHSKIDQEIFMNDFIITHEKSVVKIKLIDGSDIVLFGNSSVRIKEYSFESEENKPEKSDIEEDENDEDENRDNKIKTEINNTGLNAVLDKLSGVSRFFIRRDHERTNKVILQTGNSVLGIRGTGGFITAQGDALTKLVVTSGKVELKNLNATHKPVLVGKNQWGEIIGDIAPTPPRPIPHEMLNQLESLMPENFETTQSDYNSDDENEVNEDNQEQKDVSSEALETIDMSQQANKLQEEPLPKEEKTAEVLQAAAMNNDDNKDENKNETSDAKKLEAVEESESESVEKEQSISAERSKKPSSWEIGPTVSQGLFNFWSFGAEMRFFRFIGISANFGGSKDVDILKMNKLIGHPLKTSSDDGRITQYKANFKHQEVRAVLYPFMGSFFIGAAVGNRDLDGRPNVEINISNQLAQIAGYYRVKNSYVAPQFGWFAVFDSGFSIGTEMGVQIPLTKGSVAKSITINSTGGASVSSITSSAAYDDLLKNLDKFVTYFQDKTIPFWNIIKIGWLF